MNESVELIKRLKDSVAVLANEGCEEYDLITGVFSMWHETTSLIRKLWGSGEIEGWKNQDDPSFYRFCSMLKIGLELEKDYLSSISDQLMLEGDPVSQKIEACRGRIDSLLVKESTALRQAASLLAKEDELREISNRVDALSRRIGELKRIERKLSRIDARQLEVEVARKEQQREDLERLYKPLLEKRDDLNSSIAELNEAVDNLSAEIACLEAASGDAALRMMQSIPQWIEMITNRRTQRAEKEEEEMQMLAREAEELMEVESRIQEHIARTNEFISLTITNREVLETHFEANKTIGSKFARSLPDIQEDLSTMTDAVERELTRFDELLTSAQKRIDEIVSGFRPMGIAE